MNEKDLEQLYDISIKSYDELLHIQKQHIDEIEKLNNIIKEVRNQLSYLETYSSKEDVFDDMKRRLDRIDKIIGSDKE